MELSAGTSAESLDTASPRGFVDNASFEVARLSEAYDSLEAIIVKFDQEEDITPGAIALRASSARAKKPMSDARERMAIAVENHSSFVTARIPTSWHLGAANGRE